MPKVEKSGIYYDSKGHGIKLFAGALISDDTASKYGVFDEDAEAAELGDLSPNPTADIESTPDGEKQEGSPEAGAEVRDGVIADGEGGEVGVSSAMIEERDSAPVEGPAESTQSEIKLGGAPENRMAPAPAENRAKRKRSHNATTDAELSSDENSDSVPADALDDKDSR